MDVAPATPNLEPLPDPAWSAREPTIDDAERIARLMNDVTIAEAGVPFATVESVRDELTSPGRDDALSETIVVGADATAIGYTQVRVASEHEVHLLVFTDPRVWGRGLSAWLIRRDEARVAERWPGGVPLRLSCFGGNDAAIRLFERLGFERARTFWVMEISLAEAPPVPALADGIEIRTFERGRDERSVHAALAEAFEDHWGSAFSPFERWLHEEIDGEGARFEPTLWSVAVDGDEVVGAATCVASSMQDEDAAEIGLLGVRRGWRRRGIALALLLSTFGELHRRGIPRAHLGVDSASPTGATRLYERAGMHAVRTWEVWEKRVGAPSGSDETSHGG
jgi:mycothiol synthase